MAGDIRVERSVFGSALVTGDRNTVNVVTVVYAADVQRQLSTDPAASRNPYRGLDAFDETSASLFFGREQVVGNLVARLDRVSSSVIPGGRRLLAVMGPSGCGKSSVILAGLLPALAQTRSPWLRDATVLVFRPRHAPVESLADALGRTSAGQALPETARRALAARLREAARSGSPDSVVRVMQDAMPHDRPLLLVVDQFEELYTLCRPDDPADAAQQAAAKAERDTFVAALLAGAAEPDGRISVLLTLRSDFYGALTEHPALSAAVSEGHILVPAMERHELRRAIAEPARISGRPLPPHIVERLLDEADAASGTALPLLSFALFQIWEAVRDGADPDAALAALGGVGGALAQRADTVLEGLSKPAQALARDAFLAAVQLGEGGRDTSRRVLLEEAVPDGAAPAARAALEPFVSARLLVIAAATDRRVWIELPHEALIRHWHTLRSWIDAERDDLRLLHRAQEAAHAWHDAARKRGSLWRPPDLVRLQQLSRRRPLPALPAAFLAASARDHRFARRAAWAFGALFLLVAVGGAFALYAKRQSDLARQLADITAKQLSETNIALAAARTDLAATELATLSGQSTRSGDAMTGMLLALEAADETGPRRISAARAALLDAWLANREVAALHGDSFLTATAFLDSDFHLRLVSARGMTDWDITPGTKPASHTAVDALLKSTNGFFGWASSADGSRAAATGENGITQVFGPAGHVMTIPAQFGGRGEQLAMSDDGRRLAAAAAEGALTVWRVDVPAGTPEFEIRLPGTSAVALSRNGQILAAGTKGGEVRLWHLGRPDVTPTIFHCEAAPSMLLFDQQGDKLFTLSGGQANVWDLLPTAPAARRLVGHSGAVYGAAFSANGTHIVTTSGDLTARVWDLTDPSRPTAVLSGHTEAISHARFSPDGTRVVTASTDGTARVWDVSAGPITAPIVLIGHVGWVNDASFSPDGSRVLTNGRDGTARVWDVSTDRPRATTLPGGGGAISPDGHIIAVATADGTVSLHDLRRPERPLAEIPGRGRPMRLVSFGGDGHMLVTADTDGTLSVWRLAAGGPSLLGMVKPTVQGWMLSASFSPDGARLLTTWTDAQARIWSTADLGHEPLVLAGRYGTNFGGWGLEAAFSPDGRHVLTTWPEHATWLWDISAAAPRYDVLVETPSAFRAAFSPDGDRIALGFSNGSSEIWRRSNAQMSLLHRMPGGSRAIGKLSFSADGKRLVTQAMGGEIRIWDLAGDEPRSTVLDSTDEGIQDFDISHDGSRLVVASASGSARLWDLAGPTPAASELVAPGNSFLRVGRASFAEDGSQVIITASDGKVRVFDTPPIEQLEADARRSLTRCLTTAQREAAGLRVPAEATADRNVVPGPPCNVGAAAF